MMSNSQGGMSRAKVDKEAIIKEALERVRAADNNENLTQSERTKAHQRTAQVVKTKLFEDRRRSKSARLSRSSYLRYLSDVRLALRGEGLEHHYIKQNVAKLVAKWPEFKSQLKGLLKKTGQDRSRARGDLKKLAKSMAEDVDEKYTDAHEDFTKLKVDHDICRFLVPKNIDRVSNEEKEEAALTKRNSNTKKYNYNDILLIIKELLDSEHYSYQALGLALASGRRSVEILYHAKFRAISSNEVRFSGQVKESGGVNHDTKTTIYTLIPAEEFVASFKKFRELEAVKGLHDFDDLPEKKRNVEINRRTAKTLNETAKRVLKDDGVKFKFSRAIWSAIVIAVIKPTVEKWQKVSNEQFLRVMLRHDNVKIQNHYRYVEINLGKGKIKAKEKPKLVNDNGENLRLKRLLSLNKNPNILGRKALAKIQTFVMEQIALEPEKLITQSFISRVTGCSRPAIKEYIELVKTECGDILLDLAAASKRKKQTTTQTKKKNV